jgi:voltage-gated potassium channel Kch
MRAVVIGELEVTRLTCAALSARGVAVTHLIRPSDRELEGALTGDTDAVAVLVRGDVIALRYSLLSEHLRPGIRLVATLFDQTLSHQLRQVVPNSYITSPADIAVPSIAGACVSDSVLAIYRSGGGLRQIVDTPDGVQTAPFAPIERPSRAVMGRFAVQTRVYDDASRILLYGLLGLSVVLAADWLLSAWLLHRGLLGGFYTAVRVIATVGPGEADLSTSRWYLAVGGLLMLVTIVLTAVFTAGVVNRVLSPRSVGLIGRRTVPRRNHVVVVGLGQVGMRLATKLKTLNIPVVVVERDANATNLRLAKQAHIPVLLGHAEDRALLERLHLTRARALAAMGSDDLDNVEVAITALAVSPDLRIVLRAGENDVIAETRSLFRIGQVRDVAALTAATVTLSILGEPPRTVYATHTGIGAFDGSSGTTVPLTKRCQCGNAAEVVSPSSDRSA